MKLTVKPASSPWNVEIAQLGKLEEQIRTNESSSLTKRWEFGKKLLALREGKKVPNGLLAELVEKCNLSRSEIKFRLRFASKFSNKEQLANAVSQWSSWHEMVAKGLPSKKNKKTKSATLKSLQHILAELKAIKINHFASEDITTLEKIRDEFAKLYEAAQKSICGEKHE